MYADWGPPHLSLVVCYIFHLLIPLLCKTWFYEDCNRNCKNLVLDMIRTFGTSNQAIYYNLLNIYFSSLIDLDILIIMSPKIDAPYLWIRPLDLVPLNLQNTFYYNDHTITEFGIIDSKNLLYCICYTIWIDWHMIFGLEQEGGSLIAPIAPAHPLHPIDNRSRNRRRNLWVGWYVSSWWPLFPSRSSVLINIYVYIYICSSIWVLFSLVYQLSLALWW